MNKPLTLALGALLLGTMSCRDDDPMVVIDNPSLYTFEREGQSTVSFTGQTERIAMGSELVAAMRDFDQTAVALHEMFANETASGGDANPFSDPQLNTSTKSIKSKVAASADFFSSNTAESAIIKADFGSWIDAQVEEVFPNSGELAAPGSAGQIADGSSVRYVSGKGIEYNQVLNKALIGALMVDQMCNNYLSEQILDAADNRSRNDNGTPEAGQVYTTMEHKWDEAYGYLFGASDDPADPLVTLGEDDFLNKYLDKVDGDPDFNGIAEDIFNAFKLGRAAIVAGDYEVRDEQANLIRELVSKVIAVRAVHYLQRGKNALPASGSGYGPAFHDLSEGIGFVYSLRFTRQPASPDPYFTRAEVNGFLDQLLAGNGLWDVTPATLDQISEAIAERFDFTVPEAAE